MAVAVCGAIGFAGLAILMPHADDGGEPRDALAGLVALANGRLLREALVTVLTYTGSFVLSCYIAPLLTRVTGMSPDRVGAMMLVYDVAAALGTSGEGA